MFRKRLTIRKIFFMAGAALAVFFLVLMSASNASASQELSLAKMPDTENWKTYQNDTYKFEIKYPEQWADPLEEDISDPAFGSALKISFNSESVVNGKNAGGFWVFIYQAGACGSAEACPIHELRRLREAQNNYLYEASGQFYDYILAPVIPENDFSLSPKEDALAQFGAAMETFSFDENYQPPKKTPQAVENNSQQKTPQAVKNNTQRATAFIGKISEILAETREVNGRKVCAKKNDKPAPSKKNPKWQVDGECCLDPYEIPNASCYYPPEKYGSLVQKYLARQKK